MRIQRANSDRPGGGQDDLPPPFIFQLLGWTARDAVGFAVGAFATLTIVINVLFMQSDSHPAPFFQLAEVASKPSIPETKPMPAVAIRRVESAAGPAPAKVSPPTPRSPGEIITDIQRELSRRGYYDGPLDGLYGPRTDTAIRDFEHAAGLKSSTQPNEALLQAIIRSPGKAGKGVTGTTAVARVPTRTDAPDAASARVSAVQRALADFGYGQIRTSGIIDADTRRAIERFERERKLPVTGQITDGVVRELAAATGRPLQ